MANIFSSFADDFKPAFDLLSDCGDEESQDRDVNVLLACNMNGFFPQDSIAAVVENLSFKDKTNHVFYIVSCKDCVAVNFGGIQNCMITTRFEKNHIVLSTRCQEVEKAIIFKSKILFGISMSMEEKKHFKNYYFCDLGVNFWWKGLRDVA